MKTVFNINGGLGREICFTGIIDKYHEEHPDEEIIIIAGFTDIFQNKEYIDRVYHHHAEYLYDDVISKADKYIEIEPYTNVDYFKNMKHFINVSNMIVNGVDEFVKPNIDLLDVETKLAKEFMDNFRKENPNKKICLFQAFGATGNYKKGDPTHRSLTDEEAEQIRDILKENNYEVYMIGHDAKEKGLPDTKFFQGLSIRQIIALVPFVDLVVGIDSFMAHICSAFDKKGIFFYKTTFVENVGYDSNINIKGIGEFSRIPNRLPHNIPNPEMKNTKVKANIEAFKKILKGDL